MKHLLSITLLLLWGCSETVPVRPVVIENPPFVFGTHSNVTVERIVLNDSTTTLHMLVYQNKGNWIRIDSETYVDAGGKKQMLKEAKGIALNQEVYPDESGKIVFSLIFPPVAPSVQRIDFIESDCENCFKIYGLEINPNSKPKRITVPQKIKNEAIVKEDGKSLEKPMLKSGNAVLKGGFIGYAPSMKWKVNVYVNNPVTGIQEEPETNVKDDGSFELEVPLVSSTQVLFCVSGGIRYCKYILLSPDKESSVYFDLQQKSYQETPVESLKCPPAKYVYFGGANAEINNQLEDIGFAGFNRPDYRVIAGMNAQQYKSCIMEQAAAQSNDLAQKGLTKKALEFANVVVRCEIIHHLMFTDYYRQSAFRRAHNINDYDEPLTGFEETEKNDDFYSFMKEISINDPYFLYSESYQGIITSCKYIDNKTVQVNYVSKDDYQALIDSGKLTPEDLEIAEYLKGMAFDNPDYPDKELIKKSRIALVKEVIKSGKLNAKQLTAANKAIELCANPATTAATALTETAWTTHGILTDKEMAKIYGMINAIIEKGKTPEKFSSEQMHNFHQRCDDEINRMFAEQKIRKVKSYLARILGTDSGIAPDLLETQLICEKMEEHLTPLTDDELNKISQNENPFYFDYLRAKNEQLAAKIEKDKLKTGYTIHDIPKTDGEQAFNEIVKLFEGKVVLVDFWNTWCGPCRSAMKEFEESKNAFKDKGVVFVYLADESSPTAAWNNMICDIPGEHWRLKDTQMNELRKKFGIKGIPSYLVLNKQGEQIYFGTGFNGNDIKNKLTEALKSK